MVCYQLAKIKKMHRFKVPTDRPTLFFSFKWHEPYFLLGATKSGEKKQNSCKEGKDTQEALFYADNRCTETLQWIHLWILGHLGEIRTHSSGLKFLQNSVVEAKLRALWGSRKGCGCGALWKGKEVLLWLLGRRVCYSRLEEDIYINIYI